jgi:trigger factor
MSSEKQSEQTETTTGRDNAELTPGSESASTATTAVATATAEASESASEAVADESKLQQIVSISDAGPCRKHVKVQILRSEVEKLFDLKFTELVRDRSAPLPGFRPGKAPRRLIERRLRPHVADEVKRELLMASLEQLSNDHHLIPLAPPNLDPQAIALPDEGDFTYEFEVEVAPDFELPNYRGLKIRRPVKQFTEADVLAEEKRILETQGQIVPKPGDPPVVEEGDLIVADLTSKDGERLLGELKELQFRVKPRQVMADGIIENFAAGLAGAKPNETRVLTLKLAETVAVPELQGKSVQAHITVRDIKTIRLPELNDELLERFGANSIEHFRELVRLALERQLEYRQRQAARQQVLALITESATWDLPRDLLTRQSRKALARRVMEMRNAGLSEQEIANRSRLMQQDIVRSTAQALKEQFVLQKIAEVEKIEINESDIDAEIERLAERSGESPRRVRSRLEKENLIEALATELLERKALDLILQSAEYEDVPEDQDPGESGLASVEAQAVPGQSASSGEAANPA